MKARILIVEDNEINLSIIKKIVERKYEVVTASNGLEALEVLKKQAGQISLILLDIIMPVMNGYEFLEEVSKHPKYASIPVIVTTERSSFEDEIKALSCGATEFASKPYHGVVILHRIESILRLREASSMIYRLQTDSITGLTSREYFFECAEELRKNNPEKNYVIFCSNVENFRFINQKYGADVGNKVLKEIASIISDALPEGKFLLSRFYADYIVGMVEHNEDADWTWFENINLQLEKRLDISKLFVRFGICRDDGIMTIVEMCDNAIQTVRYLKGKYNKYYAAFDADLKAKVMLEHELVNGIERAIKEGQFELYIQPQYDKSQKEITRGEVLVRWNHNTKGMISPVFFISAFERSGVISRLDWYIWEESCKLLRRWEKDGYGKKILSVNVSRIDLFDADFIDKLLALVKKYDFEPWQLHLELTESAIVEDMDIVFEISRELQAKGFVVEMDDFGSGYSSLKSVIEMPIGAIKLDRALILSETEKPGCLKYMVGMAKWLDLKVVAEGAETKEQVDHLFDIGCDLVQGFYLAKPMHWQEFENQMVKRLN